MDVYVRVSGKQNEILTLKYVLMSRAKAYQFMNYDNFHERLKNAGYKKVIFSDGETSWTYNLE